MAQKDIKFIFRSEDSSVDTSVYQIKAKLKGGNWVGTPPNEILLTPDPVTNIPTSGQILIGTILDTATTFKIKVKIVQRTGENTESNEQHFNIINVTNPAQIFTVNLQISDCDPQLTLKDASTDEFDAVSAQAKPGSTIVIGAGMP